MAATQCRSYLRQQGIMIYHGRRCILAAGHSGRHSTPRNGVGAPFTIRWGRDYRPDLEVFEPFAGRVPRGLHRAA